MMKILYIVNNKELAASFVAKIIPNQPLKQLVATSNRLQTWIGPLVSFPSLFVLQAHLLDRVKAQRAKLVVPNANSWSLPVTETSCNCGDCIYFRNWMEDATSMTWNFKAAKKRRDHIQRRADARDLNFQLEARGSPQTLIITKKKSAIEARVNEVKKEMAELDEFLLLLGQVL